MRALVVGYGAMGQRHHRVLADLGHDVAVVSRRPQPSPLRYATIGEALAKFAPDYVVIANETASHRPSLENVRQSGFRGTVLVEKPLYESCRPDDPRDAPDTYVGYNLRFDPMLQRLRDWLHRRSIIAATVYVGRHFATLRPNREFRSSYSSSRAQGGGVLRDLSHELDYALWLFGDWQRVTAIGGASGAFGFDADDRWSIIAECNNCAQVAIGMSYLDRAPQRQIKVNAREGLVVVDLLARRFHENDAKAPQIVALARDETCRLQHQALLARKPGHTCTDAEANEVLRLIEAIEQAAVKRVWVARQ